MAGFVVGCKGETRCDAVDELPMNQISRVQQWDPREIGERGGHHVVVLADAGDVRIGIISLEDRVLVSHGNSFDASIIFRL